MTLKLITRCHFVQQTLKFKIMTYLANKNSQNNNIKRTLLTILFALIMEFVV